MNTHLHLQLRYLCCSWICDSTLDAHAIKASGPPQQFPCLCRRAQLRAKEAGIMMYRVAKECSPCQQGCLQMCGSQQMVSTRSLQPYWHALDLISNLLGLAEHENLAPCSCAGVTANKQAAIIGASLLDDSCKAGLTASLPWLHTSVLAHRTCIPCTVH